MADNTVINAGSGGDTIATDDVGGVKYQRTKTCYGADGTATDVSATSPLPTSAPDTVATVSISASGNSQAVDCYSTTSVGVVLTSLGTGGTIQFEASIDGSTWVSVKAIPLAGGAAVTSTSATGSWLVNLGGCKQFRVRASALTSGTITGTLRATGADGMVIVADGGDSLTVDGTVTSNQGSAAALGSAWPVKVTDGTNTMPTADAAARKLFAAFTDGTNTATVKAASTAAAAADTAAVVSLSPNSPAKIFDGTNTMAVKAASTAAAATDPAAVVTLSPNCAIPAPTGGAGNAALPMTIAGGRRRATYQLNLRNYSVSALTANTKFAMLSMDHASSAAKNVRITRIVVSFLVTAAGGAAASELELYLTRGTAQNTGGTVLGAMKANAAQGTEEVTIKHTPTIVAGTDVAYYLLSKTGSAGLTTSIGGLRMVVYDSSDKLADRDDLIIRAGVTESLVFNVISTNTPALSVSLEITFTEDNV